MGFPQGKEYTMRNAPKHIDPRDMRAILAGLLKDIDDGKLVLEEAQKIAHGQGEYTYVIGAKPVHQETKGFRAS